MKQVRDGIDAEPVMVILKQQKVSQIELINDWSLRATLSIAIVVIMISYILLHSLCNRARACHGTGRVVVIGPRAAAAQQ